MSNIARTRDKYLIRCKDDYRLSYFWYHVYPVFIEQILCHITQSFSRKLLQSGVSLRISKRVKYFQGDGKHFFFLNFTCV